MYLLVSIVLIELIMDDVDTPAYLPIGLCLVVRVAHDLSAIGRNEPAHLLALRNR